MAALAVMILAVLLVVAIYLTQFSLPWVAFLTGILAAAVLSMVSRASKAEWIIVRREAKINALQIKLANEIRLRRDLELKFAAISKAVTVTEVSLTETTGIAAQDLFVQSLSEQVAGPNDAVIHILSAIEHNEFCLYCQRIAPLSKTAIQSDHYEVLVRLIEEEEGMMPPGAFFPLVEKHGLMPQLDRWVVQHVIEWLSVNTTPKPPGNSSTFFINISAESIIDPTFPEFVYDQLQQHKVSAWKLCFEITETDQSLLREEVILFSKKIRDNGCKVAISNFGRNGVSFEPLYNVRADFLKIDGSIILDMLRDPADLAQVTAIARVAKTIDIKTIAEMVESEDCTTKLCEIGIDYAQGFGVSTPALLDDLD
ncbi:MAG: EAL domain-containing protein [Georgfuchsia sp.]